MDKQNYFLVGVNFVYEHISPITGRSSQLTKQGIQERQQKGSQNDNTNNNGAASAQLPSRNL